MSTDIAYDRLLQWYTTKHVNNAFYVDGTGGYNLVATDW